MKHKTRWWVFLVLISLGIFLILSLAIGMKQSIWFDEAYSINLAKRPIEEIIALTAIDVHPPMYYIFLHLWGGILGFGEVSLRLSSIIMMALAIFLMALLVKRLFGRKMALISVLGMSLAPMLVRYGLEVRMYAMATVICVAATLVIVKSEQEKSKRRQQIWQGAYAILVALGMLTLYYTIVVWITHLGYFMYRTIRNRQPIFRQSFWLTYLFAIVLFLPWLMTAVRQFHNGALAPISEPFTSTNLVGVFTFNTIYRPAWQLTQIDWLVVIILIFLIILAIIKIIRQNKNKAKVRLIVFLAIGPLVLEWLICLVKPMYVERYLVYSTPFLIGFLAYLFHQTYPKFGLGFLATLLVFGLLNLGEVGNFNFQRLQKPNTREIAAAIRANNLPILADSPYEAIELGYYLDYQPYFYAPYDTLGGGYAPLNNSELKVANIESMKDAGCFNYVYYENNLEEKLVSNGFVSSETYSDGAMKYAIMCKSDE